MFTSGASALFSSPSASEEKYVFTEDQGRVLDSVFADRLRRPLFVIGSGLSCGQGVPGMRAVFSYLEERLCKPDVFPEGETQGKKTEKAIIEEAQNLAKLLLVPSRSYRPTASRFFAELQDSRVRALRTVWQDFCEAFVAGQLVNSKPIWDLKPSDSHQKIAELCRFNRAVCLSFNFDGLMQDALQSELDKLPHNLLRKAFILDSAEKIQRFYARDEISSGCSGVLKIRGDVFYAICGTSGCPSAGRWAAVYEFKKKGTNKDPRKRAKEILECSECGARRSLRISFPGIQEKEREADEIISEMWRYIAPSVSGIFVLGLSGIWDENVIRFVFRLAKHNSVPVFDVKKLPPALDLTKISGGQHESIERGDEGDSETFIERYWQQYAPDVIFHRVRSYADPFMRALAGRVQQNKSNPVQNTSPISSPVDLRPDGLWSTDNELFVPVRAGSSIRSAVGTAHSGTSLPYILSSEGEVRWLQNYSMLGLKDFWWGRSAFRNHNRLLHSLGVLRIASGWLKSLGPALNKTMQVPGEDLERQMDLIMTAALLHDFGHLPFSHLFEEIFARLNWTTHPRDGSYSHEALGRERIGQLFKNKEYEMQLHKTGFSLDQLLAVINGCSGTPYLDAIINSPIDADKIDYIFRDIAELRLGARLMSKDVWLQEFLEDQDVSPEGLIRLHGRSALRLLELLETRQALYSDFYLAPWIRFMEAITATIITKFIVHYTSTVLLGELGSGLRGPLEPDLNRRKIEIATSRLRREYETVVQDQERSQGVNRALEWPLLKRLLDLLLAEMKPGLDPAYADFLSRLREILVSFEEAQAPRSSESNKGGILLRKVYQQYHLAGPFLVDRDQRRLLSEVIREIEVNFPDKVLFCIIRPPKFLATASSRQFGKGLVGENVLVPGSKPETWNMKSKANVPLHLQHFSTLEKHDLGVILMNPWGGAHISGRYVLDVFRTKCSNAQVHLKE